MAQPLRVTAVAALAVVAWGSSGSGESHTYTIGGACDVEGGIDGLTFVQEGSTKSGAPYFKALDSDVYMFFDPDCEGGAEHAVARWVIDHNKPDVTKEDDLDSDSACNYIAHIDSNDPSQPPLHGEWTMNCDGLEEEHVLTLREQGGHETGPVTPVEGGRGVTWEGACALKQFVNGVTFDEVGATADGRPYFKAQDRNEYIFYDADCDGPGTTNTGRWILDNHQPSTTAAHDLDSDGVCDYHARWVGDSDRPPALATWHMYCGEGEDGWADVEVTLHEAGEADEAEEAEDSTTPRVVASVNSARRNTVLIAAAVLAVSSLFV